MTNCDATTGVCSLPGYSNSGNIQPVIKATVPTVRYIGDPMCSWCWGIAPTLKTVAVFCQSNNINFSVTVGGLRPGGGDEWNTSFKEFLRHEWVKIHRVTGQPFGFSLLDKAEFHYDTEPACRAVVAMTQLLDKQKMHSLSILEFFSGIQRKFYVDGADPKLPEFYTGLCADAGVVYEKFLELFLSDSTKAATVQEFECCKRWGISGFPSIGLDRDGNFTLLTSGHTSSTTLIEKLVTLLGTPPSEETATFQKSE